jgi:hypothetical protein
LAKVAGGGDVVSVPVPLGVRLYSIVNPGERWVTRWVDDISFRSVVPGGFASATITVRIPRNLAALPSPDPLGFSELTDLFRRVQVVDLRTMEIAWEGRIEDPARQVEPDTWQIGALGSMVAATDIQRPVFYVDSSLDRWATGDLIDNSGEILLGDNPDVFWSTSKDDRLRSLTTTYKTGYTIFDVNEDYSWRWDSHGYDQPIARFTITQKGFGPNTSKASTTDLLIGIAANNSLQLTKFNATETTKTSVIGTNFTDANTRYILVGSSGSSGSASYTVTTTDAMILRVREPKVVGQRYDRFGTRLTTAASYPGSYVTVAQVVEDVVGRFLVSGWYEDVPNLPWPGSVRPQDVYIDSSDTTHILHLAYPEGATAAVILNDLISQVQPDAYWAIWESKWGAAAGSDFGTNSGFRFEYTTWPANWGYLATSQDGLESQPNGDDVYNFAFYRFPSTDDANAPHVFSTWLGPSMAPELLNGGFTRAITVNKSDPIDENTAAGLVAPYLDSKKRVLNAGTLTVRRPIQLYDAGATSAAPFTITEDFEDATLNITVTNAGNAAWARSTTTPHTGSWSLKSGTITDGQTSDAIVTVPAGATQVRFWYRVSSENTFDFFRFFTGGVQQFQSSGAVGWTQSAAYNVTGVSAITFRYVKDATQSGGEDAAYIDDVVFTGTTLNSGNGASRMLDPWMVRPGKLVRITDLPPRAMENDLSSGSMLPSPSIDGTIFRVVATDYSSSDNSCRMSLDQVTRWQIPTQIDQAGSASKTIRIQ